LCEGSTKALAGSALCSFCSDATKLHERVLVAGVGPEADIGRDLRQHLVAGDQQIELGAIKAGMLRRMAAADDDAPGSPADHELHAVGKTVILLRHRSDQAAVALRPADLDRLLDVAEADAAVEIGELAMEGAGPVGDRLARMAPFAVGGPKLDAEPLGEPAGKAHMVGVEMRADEPRHLLAVERAGEDPLPEPFGLGIADAGIDDCPAGAVLHEPEIDVVELKRQRHAQPAHARRHVQRRARRRRCRMRETQRGEILRARAHAVPTRSNTAAMPWPTPMHMVTSA
jgi:hypothetical protein